MAVIVGVRTSYRSAPATLAGGCRGVPRAHRGFTLVELVMVIVIIGVLSIFAAPLLFGRSDVDARGLHDETLAYLRFAQKQAIAQRRTVCVTFLSSSATLTYASAAGSPTCAAGNLLPGPGKDGSPTVSARSSGVAYASSPGAINFNSLGQPVDSSGAVQSSAATVQVANMGTATLVVEGGTGYVHD